MIEDNERSSLFKDRRAPQLRQYRPIEEAEINGYYPGFYGKEDRGYTYINYFFDGDSPVIRDAVSLFGYPSFKGVLIRTDSTILLLFTSMSYSVSCSVIVLYDAIKNGFIFLYIFLISSKLSGFISFK